MEQKLKLTEDEEKWLKIVTQYGSEVTKYLRRKYGQFKGTQDWFGVQYGLYEKVDKR